MKILHPWFKFWYGVIILYNYYCFAARVRRIDKLTSYVSIKSTQVSISYC